MLTIYTIQMAQAKKLPEGFNRCDVTFMSKDRFLKKNFAPPNYDMIRRMKKGEMTEGTYVDVYHAHLETMSNRNEAEWLEFLKQDNVVLMCFCPVGGFCHRHSLADYLRLFAIRHGIDVTVGGELDIENLPELTKVSVRKYGEVPPEGKTITYQEPIVFDIIQTDKEEQEKD